MKKFIALILLFLSASFLLASSAEAKNRAYHILVADSNNHRVVEIDVKTKKITWQYGTTGEPGKGPNRLYFPLRVYRLTNKNTLIVEADNGRVIEVTPQGKVVWKFGGSDVTGPFYPVDARRLKDGNTLITNWAGQDVVEVGPEKKIIWRYVGGKPDELNYPLSSSRMENGNTLITDSQNFRVIEVDQTGRIAWQYGAPGGSDRRLLYFPVDALRLGSGNTLVVDRETSRVLEVGSSKSILWQYGGSKGSGSNQLNDPSQVARLDEGETLIADKGNHRVIVVNRGGKIVWSYGSEYTPGRKAGELFFPSSAQGVTPELALSSIRPQSEAGISISTVVQAIPVLMLVLASVGLLYLIVKRESQEDTGGRQG